jgi:alanyl-tRNA synthetase
MSQDPEASYLQEFEFLKRSVIARFQNQRTEELNQVRRESYQRQKTELTEKIKRAEKAKDRKTFANLNAELKSLNYDPVEIDISTIVSLETIQTRAKQLHDQLEAKETELMEDNNLEASMLCEVKRLNLLNLLKVFEVKIELGENSVVTVGEEKEENSRQFISELQSELSRFADIISTLESDLVLKVKNFLEDASSHLVRRTMLFGKLKFW